MGKLAVILYIIIGPTLAGLGALVPLTMFGVNDFNALYLVASAAAGAILAMPVAWYVANHLTRLMANSAARQPGEPVV
ncbi:hypothetical protein GCM10011316_33990 [Roseibium aquae]|uniref:Uncharacterized protein n=1 Tax=Roseibium aquae TaxID=1323746 RepID=A0A916TPT8_9HYPH|nr:hypothetical protein [Roseibium aquae]GGB59155.1 hypothetical protein GCM10011316_33990 [Roseibium aquae]